VKLSGLVSAFSFFLNIRISERFHIGYFTIEFPFWSKNARSLSETQRGLSETQPGLSQTSNRLSENSLLLSERVIKLKNTYRKKPQQTQKEETDLINRSLPFFIYFQSPLR
jgi:hypothetical protein